jgi:acetyl coenzyme A synthetase (ADP forming)-like protein
MPESLRAFFNPSGVAIIGASSDPRKLGYAVARNMVHAGYTGSVYFVNPKGGELFDRVIYPTVMDIPDPVDLAVVIVPAQNTPQAMKEIGMRGIHAAIITSGGFRETGENGAALELEVVKICRENRIRLIGPNCIGLLDSHLPLDTTFLPPPPPQSGNIAFLSHSGAFCAAVIDWSRLQGFGFSRLVSLGNQADLTETDLLPEIANDPHTRSIALYLETIPDGLRFIEAARRLTPIVPIVALKAGRTASGQKAAASHTGALAGTESAVNAAFEKAGVQRAVTSEELFDWARAMSFYPLPKGRNIAILTNAGGPGVIAADALNDHRLTLASLSSNTINTLKGLLPSAANVYNPVDMLASASPTDYAACLSLLLDDDQVHSVIVIIPPSPVYPTEHIARTLVPLIQKSSKPVIPVLMGSKLIKKTFQYFNRFNIPTYPFSERAVSSLARLADRADFLKAIEGSQVVSPLLNELEIRDMLVQFKGDNYDPNLVFRLMESIGIRTASVRLAKSQKEASLIASHLGFPLVAKIASPDIEHKTDVGGVMLNLNSSMEVNEAFKLLLERAREKKPEAYILGLTLQRQIPPGHEVIIGMVRDPQFGALIMFGSGGIDVEGLNDIAFALAPLSRIDAERLLLRTWAGRKLSGYRNLPPADRAAVIEALVNFSWLAVKYPQISECEINPLRVLTQGVVALDVRMKLHS